MTHDGSSQPNYLGGGGYGEYRKSIAKASGDPAETGGSSDDGTGTVADTISYDPSTDTYIYSSTRIGTHTVKAQDLVTAQVRYSAGQVVWVNSMAQYQAYGNGILYGAPPSGAWAREPEPEIEDAGIRAGEIIGWRAWRIFQDDPYEYLRSMFAINVWIPGEPMTGNVDWVYGVHAFKTKEEAILNYSFHAVASDVVIGRIALWGKVIEHELGYRAEYGAIESLDEMFTTKERYKRWPWSKRAALREKQAKLKALRLRYLPNSQPEE